MSFAGQAFAQMPQRMQASLTVYESAVSFFRMPVAWVRDHLAVSSRFLWVTSTCHSLFPFFV